MGGGQIFVPTHFIHYIFVPPYTFVPSNLPLPTLLSLHMCRTLHVCPYIFDPPYTFVPTLVSPLTWPTLHFLPRPTHFCLYTFAPPCTFVPTYLPRPTLLLQTTFLPQLTLWSLHFCPAQQFYPTLHFSVGRDTKKWAHFVSKRMGPLRKSFTHMSVFLSHVSLPVTCQSSCHMTVFLCEFFSW